MKAMILAAGRGERMRPLTDNIPKPLLKAGGKHLIQYHIEALNAAGFKDLVINHAYLGAQIEAALGNGEQFGVNIKYSPEGTALGTAGGIINALPLLGTEPFAVINGDIWCEFPYTTLQAQLPLNILAHLVLIENPLHNINGDFTLQGSHKVVNAGDGQRLTFSGIGIYHPDLFTAAPVNSFALAPILRNACDHGQVNGQHYQGRWLDVGTPQRLQELARILAAI
ncbi:mannose-1-phosphate guanylyltransferase [Achromatium sp. WMS1]|nr:mannose-1-phosphate guanylyltransferase [Achromatium sp. WMS1]